MLARPCLTHSASAGPSRLSSSVTRSLHSSSSPRAIIVKSTARFTWGVPPPAPPVPQPHAKPSTCTHTSWPGSASPPKPEFVPTPNHQRRSMAAWGPPLSGPPDRRIDPIQRPAARVKDVLAAEVGEVTLDQYLVELTNALAAKAVAAEGGVEGRGPGLAGLLAAARSKAGEVLPVELKGEHAPHKARKVQCSEEVANSGAEQDGVVLVAHVVGGGKGTKSKVVMSSGFAVGTSATPSASGPQTILTCLHPLEQAVQTDSSISAGAAALGSTPSATFALTSSGHVYAATAVPSSLPGSDLLLLTLADQPCVLHNHKAYPPPVKGPAPSRPAAPSGYVAPKYTLGDSMVETLRKEMQAWRAERARRASVGETEVATGLSNAVEGGAGGLEASRLAAVTDAVPRLRTLPMSPYPATVGTKVGMRVYGDPMGRVKGSERWTFGNVIEYKTPHGKVAEPGSYDDLAKMTLSSIPEGGCSGGPIVDVNSGAVVGIVRGSTHSYGDRQQRGFATPAEKVFELFALAGFVPASAKIAAAAKKAAEEAAAAQVVGKADK